MFIKVEDNIFETIQSLSWNPQIFDVLEAWNVNLVYGNGLKSVLKLRFSNKCRERIFLGFGS